MIARHYVLTGIVQGVGFRPFVYRLACTYQLQGWIRNQSGQAHIWAQGLPAAVAAFEAALITQAPPLAKPTLQQTQTVSPDKLSDFQILSSCLDAEANAPIHVPLDYNTCPACQRELLDPANRRYHYPFTHCTDCGPRYTLLHQLPYDRAHTTLAEFALCSDCQREYITPANRRFHAQPIACPRCGPQLNWYQCETGQHLTAQLALVAALDALKSGQIVAVKGIGGYHLMMDARCSEAIQRLRQRKPRPDKPLAVMFPAGGTDELAHIQKAVILTRLEADYLRSAQRPIVIAPIRDGCGLAPELTPGLRELGVFLPYSPLHYLLLEQLATPLVATSANISGEPVLTDPIEAQQRLQPITPCFLHHNRPIARPAEDAVFRRIDNQMRPIRLGRGGSPLEWEIAFMTIPTPTLALGGHIKNTIALAWDHRIVISPHIGDLDSVRGQTIFKQTMQDLQRLYRVTAQQLICDAHPRYASSRWAKQQHLPLITVYHHAAHASALVAEHWTPGPWLVFTWDGTGYGADHQLWGGEALLGCPGNWQRFASVRQFAVPGGDQASREPWRCAASLCWEAGVAWPDCPVDTHLSNLLKQAWQAGLNCPRTSAIGRLFDAAASLLGIVHKASYDGQGPQQLEQRSFTPLPEMPALPLEQDQNGLWRLNWQPLLSLFMDKTRTIEERAAQFHSYLAHSILRVALQAKSQYAITQIGLTGGVFQNRLLTEYTAKLLRQQGFSVALPQRLPSNDGGLSFGQIIEAFASRNQQ